MMLDPRWHEAWTRLPDYLGNHVRVSLTALALGLVVSLPLALMVRRRPVMRGALLALASIVQTVPGLALLALFYPLLLALAQLSLTWFGFEFSAFGFLPGTLNLRWANLFAQDEIALRDNLRLTAGLKIEDNNYTGVEVLPTLRLAWNPRPASLVWTSLSRAVRAPSRIDRDFYSPINPRVVNGVPQYAVAGGPGFDSETANVFELGYRGQPSASLSYSTMLFFSRYDRLRTLEPNQAGPGSVFENRAEGLTRGIEAWATWQAANAWRLSAGGVVQRVGTTLEPGSRDQSGTTGLFTSDPTHYWQVRSSYDIGAGQEFDVTLRHVGALPRPSVPAYTAVDARWGWRIRIGS